MAVLENRTKRRRQYLIEFGCFTLLFLIERERRAELTLSSAKSTDAGRASHCRRQVLWIWKEGAPEFHHLSFKKKNNNNKTAWTLKLNVTIPVPFVVTEEGFTLGPALSQHGVLDICYSRHESMDELACLPLCFWTYGRRCYRLLPRKNEVMDDALGAEIINEPF